MALTLRLSEEQQEKLNRVQRLTDNSTASGCIKSMIDRWEFITMNLNLNVKRIAEQQAEIDSLRSLIIKFVEADKRRSQLLTQMKEI